METYGVTLGYGADVEEGESLITLKELEGRDLSYICVIVVVSAI